MRTFELVYGETHYPLQENDIILGRHPNCGLCVDCVGVSRHHARLFMQDGSFWIEDLGSRIGTYINGQRISQPTLVSNGDQIGLGPTIIFIFISHFDTERPASAATDESFARDQSMRAREPMASTKRGVFEDEKQQLRDNVDCTVFAPPVGVIDDALMIQVYAHMPHQAGQVQNKALEFDEDAICRGATSLGTKVERGSKLTFELLMQHVEVNDPVQEITWRGSPESVQFDIEIPATARERTVIGKVTVSQESVPIGVIKFKLKLLGRLSGGLNRDDALKLSAHRGPTGDAIRYSHAFVSYASEDRKEVLRRVQMLNAVGIEFFQDVLNLNPGQRWEQHLYKQIDVSDVMFLFWSNKAKESPWVTKEWQYGLEKKGDDFIQPVIIEGPPIAPPLMN